MHRLLKRQLEKHLKSTDQQSVIADFINSVDAAYHNFDDDYQQLERTLEVSMRESFKELSDYKNAMSISAMVIILDSNFRVTSANEIFENISGYKADDIIGNKLFIICSDFHSNEFYTDLFDVIKSGNVWKGEVCDRKKSGEYYWTSTTIVPLKNEEGAPKKYITYKFDITKMKEAESGLIQAKLQAEQALRIKSEFLSNMSHEIRTPLNAIIGLTDYILRSKHGSETMDNLMAIKNSGENLLVIINDILDFSKLEAGKVQIENIDFDFHYQLRHIYTAMLQKAQDKGIRYFISIDDNIPKIMIGDPFRLNQILMNLIGNAIKFTSIGEVSVSVNLISQVGEELLIRFTVSDTGIGISSDQASKIFESFSQASPDITRTYGGTGLGLAISQQLVKLMNGSITVDSAIGKGSDFTIEIPLKYSKLKSLEVENGYSMEYDLEGYRILVFEDNIINQRVVGQLLRKWNCNFELVENGEIGLTLMEKEIFDLILMDLQMPVKDGFETTREIRQGRRIPSHKNIPIIALTADAFPETKVKVMESGMNDFVSKPFNSRALNNKIFELIYLKKG